MLIALLGVVGAGLASTSASATARSRSAVPVATSDRADPPSTTRPIKHIIVMLKENHSFDNLLGPWCAQTQRCNGIALGTRIALSAGASTTLRPATDKVPDLRHDQRWQLTAWDKGKDDGWNKVKGCDSAPSYPCVTAAAPGQLPNLDNFASQFVVSDATQTCNFVASFIDHVQWMTACNADGFTGPNPGLKGGIGWGCDSKRLVSWTGTSGKPQQVPTCIPSPNVNQPNGGAFRPTPVPYTRTIAENCDALPGCTWKTYATPKAQNHGTYIFAINPTFAQLLYGHNSTASVEQFMADAETGNLPSLSFVEPSVLSGNDSWHNATSLAFGDKILGQEVQSVMDGPEWDSTAIFITWDDCGCFYDHVSPRRVPMVIVSPYARAGFTDSTPVTFAGVHRFIEESLGLPAMNSMDASSYDYRDSFDFSQPPLKPVRVVADSIPASSRSSVSFAGSVDTSDPDDPS